MVWDDVIFDIQKCRYFDISIFRYVVMTLFSYFDMTLFRYDKMRGCFNCQQSETEIARHEVVPKDDEHDNDGDSDAWVEASAVGVGTLEVLGKLAAVGFNVGLILRCLATLDLFFALGFGHELVKFILAL